MVNAHVHTLTEESTTQGDSQLFGSSEGEGISLRDTSTLREEEEEEPGFELASSRLPANPLHLLSRMQMNSRSRESHEDEVVVRRTYVPDYTPYVPDYTTLSVGCGAAEEEETKLIS